MRKSACIEPWNVAQVSFLRDAVAKASVEEATRLLNDEFGTHRTRDGVKSAMARFGIKTGRTGRFERGSVPHNKGRTWDEAGFSSEKKERMLATCFKRGNEPANGARVPVGTERVSKDGYIEVKVKRFSDRPRANKCWKMKHRLVWEEANGRPVPPSSMIVFADRDNRNFDPGNLVCVPRSLWAVVSHEGIEYFDRESLETALAVARIKVAAYEAECHARECATCGRSFAPRFSRQANCDECIDSKSRRRS